MSKPSAKTSLEVGIDKFIEIAQPDVSLAIKSALQDFCKKIEDKCYKEKNGDTEVGLYIALSDWEQLKKAEKIE